MQLTDEKAYIKLIRKRSLFEKLKNAKIEPTDEECMTPEELD
jgi:hypothetical protein